MPLRPTVDAIDTLMYQLTKLLAGLLTSLVGHTEHHVKNSADFIQRLKCAIVKETDILISFDVVSLFTEVPLKETIQLLEQQFEGGILDLFRQTLTSTYYLMGNSLSRRMA
jgi:hypothetical protein